ncbi:hypothetical protein [Aliarcobacter cryaerophilus]|uniref:hypothetical protein n=1 Tax=Aliarcobacter cryaerophilus TaxID=28198 RepID=UPI00083194F2|nr:hypothetical protein [Aliarcobacter cryaerophilus]
MIKVLGIIPKRSDYLNRYISFINHKKIDEKLILLVEHSIYLEVEKIFKNNEFVLKIFTYESIDSNSYLINTKNIELSNLIRNEDCLKTIIFDKITNTSRVFLENFHQQNFGHLYHLVRFSFLLNIKDISVFNIGSQLNLSVPTLLDSYVDIHKGKRAFIIGNGPSLNDIDMSLLKNEITFGSNRGYLGFKKWGFNFNYWSIGDRLQLEEHLDEWENIENLSKDIVKFFPFEYLNLINLHNSCPINFHYGYKDFPKFSIEPSNVYLGHSILYTLLQIACVMGIKELYLVGADHNYNLSETQEYKGAQIWTHSLSTSQTHFDDKYNDPKNNRRFIIPRPEKAEEAFSFAYKYANEKGIKILNATPNTKLKSIPTVTFNTLF